MRLSLALVVTCFAAVGLLAAETKSPAPQDGGVDTDGLYEAGRQLFDQYAPPDVKAQYEFPSKDQWDAFAARLQGALQGDSLSDLAQYAPQARAALSTLRGLGADEDLADWIEQRLDEAEAAQQVPRATQTPPRAERPPTRPGVTPKAPVASAPPASLARLPYYELWLTRVQNRPAPARATELMPTLRSAFAAEGVPPALAWLAEAESSLNPTARSPAGARGLFQLMPDTAHNLGLGTFLPDDRTNPEKSAHAAARYLRQLHEKFGDWPLTFAAYNAGEGRVSRMLTARKGRSFADIADALPAETRMYVPKVCALVAVRSGRPITAL